MKKSFNEGLILCVRPFQATISYRIDKNAKQLSTINVNRSTIKKILIQSTEPYTLGPECSKRELFSGSRRELRNSKEASSIIRSHQFIFSFHFILKLFTQGKIQSIYCFTIGPAKTIYKTKSYIIQNLQQKIKNNVYDYFSLSLD